MEKINLQEIKDFIERPKLTKLNDEYVFPKKFEFLKPFIFKKKIVGKQSKTGKEYYKYMLLSDDAKSDDGSHFTPIAITNFVNQYIKLNNFNFKSALDFTSGIGAFIYSIDNIQNKEISLWDINKNSIDISKAIAKELELNADFKVVNTLEKARESINNEITLDLFLSNRNSDSQEDKQYDLLTLNPPFNLDKNSNYDFIKYAIRLLSDNGKAFIVLPRGVLSGQNKEDISSRNWLIQKGYLDGVVDFEGGIFENTTIPTTMFILSKKRTDWFNVKYYDLTDMKLPLENKQTKINPLSGRKYYKNIKRYDLWKLKESHGLKPLKNYKEEFGFRMNIYMPEDYVYVSENFWHDNLRWFIEKGWDRKDDKNWFSQVCKVGTQPIINELEKLLKLHRNSFIDTDKVYKESVKNPMKFSLQLEDKILELKPDIKELEKFRIECSYIQKCLIRLLVK